MECYPEFCRALLVGLRLTSSTALYSRSVVCCCGPRRTWEKDIFRRVAVAVTDRFAVDATHELSVLASVVAAVGGSASLVAVSGGSHVFSDTYGEYLGSWYSHKLVEYPVFDLRLQKRCLQKVSFSVLDLWIPFLWRSLLSRVWGGRASRLDDVTFQSSSFHHQTRAVDAIACWGRQQHRGSVASYRGLPQGDCKKNWWRQLSGMIHSALLIHLELLSHLHLTVFF